MKKILATVFCSSLFFQFAVSQNWTPDLSNSFGEGTTKSVTTATNSETMIPETKTVFKDAKGIVRKERSDTKDIDGNKIIKQKEYDENGRLIKESEHRLNDQGQMIFSDSKNYDVQGKVSSGTKYVRGKDESYFYEYDVSKQEYKEKPRVITSVIEKKENVFACNSSKISISGGYSYLQSDTDPYNSFPTGFHAGLNYRFHDKYRMLIEGSYHTTEKNDHNVTRIIAMTGVERNNWQKEQRLPISVFSRIAIGMMHERMKSKTSNAESSASGFAAGAGVGVQKRISCQAALRAGVNYIYADVGEGINNFRVDVGIILHLDDKHARN